MILDTVKHERPSVPPSALGRRTCPLMPEHRRRTQLTLMDVVEQQARSHPQWIAESTRGTRITYPQLHERVRQTAAALSSAGVGPGERVLWLGQNHHRVLELLLACGHLGAMFCPVNWRQSAEELAVVHRDLDP